MKSNVRTRRLTFYVITRAHKGDFQELVANTCGTWVTRQDNGAASPVAMMFPTYREASLAFDQAKANAGTDEVDIVCVNEHGMPYAA